MSGPGALLTSLLFVVPQAANHNASAPIVGTMLGAFAIYFTLTAYGARLAALPTNAQLPLDGNLGTPGVAVFLVRSCYRRLVAPEHHEPPLPPLIDLAVPDIIRSLAAAAVAMTSLLAVDTDNGALLLTAIGISNPLVAAGTVLIAPIVFAMTATPAKSGQHPASLLGRSLFNFAVIFFAGGLIDDVVTLTGTIAS